MLPTGMAWAGQRKEGSSSDEKKWGVKNLWRTIISSVGVFGLGPPQSFLPIGKWKIINVTNNQSRIGSLHDKTFDLMQWNRSIEKKTDVQQWLFEMMANAVCKAKKHSMFVIGVSVPTKLLWITEKYHKYNIIGSEIINIYTNLCLGVGKINALFCFACKFCQISRS